MIGDEVTEIGAGILYLLPRNMKGGRI